VERDRRQAAPGDPEVGHVVRDAVTLDLSRAPAEGDVHPLGLEPLDPRELIHVRADLEEGARLGVARELGVHDLVAPGTEGARRLDTHEEVGVPEPAAVEERGLVDDVVPAADGGLGVGGGAAKLGAAIRDGLVPLDPRDPTARGLQVGQIALLVGHSALLQDVQLRVLAHRPLHQARRGRELERGQMLAGEEADEIRGREDGLAADDLHEAPNPGPIRMPCGRAGRGPLVSPG